MTCEVSIIIPVYNRVDYLPETLDSIISQTYQHWECILVDDGSTDNSIEIAKKYASQDPRIKSFIRNREPKSANTCRNIGFEHSTGKYIVWFDSDDIILETYIEDQLWSLENEQCDFSICGLYKYYTEPRDLRKWLSDDWQNDNYETFIKGYLLYKYGVITGSFMWTRKLVEQTNLYNEELIHADEWEFFSRIFLDHKRLKFGTCKQELIYYRQHGDNYYQQWKSGNLKKLKSSLNSRYLVLERMINNGFLDNELEKYFITDALNHLKINTNGIHSELLRILGLCDLSSKEALQIKNASVKIANQTRGRIDFRDIYEFIRQSPSARNVYCFIIRFWIVKIFKTILYKLGYK